jgi:cytochrome c oxidase cbb3-type subunit 3
MPPVRAKASEEAASPGAGIAWGSRVDSELDHRHASQAQASSLNSLVIAASWGRLECGTPFNVVEKLKGLGRLLALALTIGLVAPAAGQPEQQTSPGINDEERLQVPPQFDRASAERGQSMLVANCGFCHGTNARGGAGGPDLTRSPLVQEDLEGRQIGQLLKAGRPDRGMPSFAQFSESQVKDIATFLHSQIYLNSNRRLYAIGNILVGDPKRGQSIFEGSGACASCHSAEKDLKGIGALLDPVALQRRILLPRAGGQIGLGPGGDKTGYLDPNALQVTIATRSGRYQGRLVRLSDFNVTLYDPVSGTMQSFTRAGNEPLVTLTDPLKAHVDRLYLWNDRDLHDVTAYLAGLK